MRPALSSAIRCRGVVVAVALIVGGGGPILAAPAQAAPVAPAVSNTYRHGSVPTVDAASPHAARTTQAPSGNLSFGGGNTGVGVTVGAPRVYLVFWGSQWGTQGTDGAGYLTLSGDPQGMAPDLQRFMSGLGTGSETWSGVMTQYCEAVAAGAQSCPAAAAHVGYPAGGALAGVWADTATPAPGQASASGLAAEAASAANHFGNTTEAANRNAQYFVVSPTGTHPDRFNTAPLPGPFCAWHDFTSDPNLAEGPVASPFGGVAFTNMPYVTDLGSSCGANFVNSGPAGALDGVTIVAGHEYAETITDQFPVGGWVDVFRGENGDKCAWIYSGQGAAQNLVLTTGSFAVQSTWANDANTATGGCLISHEIVATGTNSAPAITSVNGASFSAGAAGSFTVTASGYPVPTLAATGTLPPGVAFTDNHDGSGVLAGNPSPRALGSYPLTLTAANGVGPDATRSFILTVSSYGVIVNLAGSPSGASGTSGDGGPATSALLDAPWGVAVDSSGNTYIADYFGGRVRKVDRAGTITNFAGDTAGVWGVSGDGGPAVAARLGSPNGVAVDTAGNVYISDMYFNVVRKVDTKGIISTVAGGGNPASGTGDGGPATSAILSQPRGMAVDAAGNLYIADSTGNRVRKVDPAGVITTFAGNAAGTSGNAGDGGPATSANLGMVPGVALDPAGNVYIVDEQYHRVRKVDAGGTISNFAGSPAGNWGNTGDGGPATAATLKIPYAIAVGPTGDLYIADQANNRIRRVDHAGIITNVAGDPTGVPGNAGDGGPPASATLLYPFGVAVDPGGNVYISSWNNHRVRLVRVPVAPAITSAPSAVFTVGVPGTLTVTPTGIPAPTVTETGALPPGVTFSAAATTLSGTPAQGSAGSYPVSFTAANGVGPGATQSFALTVNQATMTYPADGQTGIDTTLPFTWTTIPQAQAYFVIVGTRSYTADLASSGVLGPGVSSFNVPALPAGPTLHATLFAQVNGAWTSYHAIAFTAAGREAAFTYPVNGQADVNPTAAFTWSTTPRAQGYILVAGTTPNGTNLFNSGVLAPTTSTFTPPQLPSGQILFATLLTEFNGAFTGSQSVVFIARAATGTLTRPVNGQPNVNTPVAFTWSTIAGADNYYLAVGTTVYGSDLVNSGLLPPTQSSFTVTALPHGQVLYATVLTRVNGTWRSDVVGFTAG